MGTKRRFPAALLICLCAAGAARAWYADGHVKATRAALTALKGRLPEFFLRGFETVVKTSPDPDLLRLRQVPELRDAESPEHFLDLELLSDAPLPAKRSEYLLLCARRRLNPSRVGYVPYAVVEWTQRLTIAFAEHRRFPDDPHIRTRCLVYAGLLAHYAQDLCQPLHTTVHYDGRVGADGVSPRTGIHAKVDALLGKAPAGAGLVRAGRVKPLSPLMASVAAELRRSHALVDRVYAIEKHLPDVAAPLAPASPAAAFARERLRAAAEFTAALYLTAWTDSARIELPDWFRP